MNDLDLSTRISFYTFDEDEVIERQKHKPSVHAPDEYVLLHECSIINLHNDMHDCLEAFHLVLDHAYNNTDTRGYYENLSLIFKRLTRIGNQLDADLMRKQHSKGPGKNIQPVLVKRYPDS